MKRAASDKTTKPKPRAACFLRQERRAPQRAAQTPHRSARLPGKGEAAPLPIWRLREAKVLPALPHQEANARCKDRRRP